MESYLFKCITFVFIFKFIKALFFLQRWLRKIDSNAHERMPPASRKQESFPFFSIFSILWAKWTMSVTFVECWLWGIRAEILAGSSEVISGKNVFVIPPLLPLIKQQLLSLVSGTLGRRHSRFYRCVAAPGIGGPLRSPTFTTGSLTSLIKHAVLLPWAAIFSPLCTPY